MAVQVAFDLEPEKFSRKYFITHFTTKTHLYKQIYFINLVIIKVMARQRIYKNLNNEIK